MNLNFLKLFFKDLPSGISRFDWIIGKSQYFKAFESVFSPLSNSWVPSVAASIPINEIAEKMASPPNWRKY